MYSSPLSQGDTDTCDCVEISNKFCWKSCKSVIFLERHSRRYHTMRFEVLGLITIEHFFFSLEEIFHCPSERPVYNVWPPTNKKAFTWQYWHNTTVFPHISLKDWSLSRRSSSSNPYPRFMFGETERQRKIQRESSWDKISNNFILLFWAALVSDIPRD